MPLVVNSCSISARAGLWRREPANRPAARGWCWSARRRRNRRAGGSGEHFAKYLPGADIGDANYLFGTQQGQILEQVLKQAGDNLSRENIVKQSRSIRGLSLPTLIPGVTVNTGPESSAAYTQLQLQRWNGSTWDQFGKVLSAEDK